MLATSSSSKTRPLLTRSGWRATGEFASILVVGLTILDGKVWGRVTAILLALLSMAVNFVFLPWYPVWSLLMIALDVAVISALVVYQRRWNDAALAP